MAVARVAGDDDEANISLERALQRAFLQTTTNTKTTATTLPATHCVTATGSRSVGGAAAFLLRQMSPPLSLIWLSSRRQKRAAATAADGQTC